MDKDIYLINESILPFPALAGVLAGAAATGSTSSTAGAGATGSSGAAATTSLATTLSTTAASDSIIDNWRNKIYFKQQLKDESPAKNLFIF